MNTLVPTLPNTQKQQNIPSLRFDLIFWNLIGPRGSIQEAPTHSWNCSHAATYNATNGPSFHRVRRPKTACSHGGFWKLEFKNETFPFQHGVGLSLTIFIFIIRRLISHGDDSIREIAYICHEIWVDQIDIFMLSLEF